MHLEAEGRFTSLCGPARPLCQPAHGPSLSISPSPAPAHINGYSLVDRPPPLSPSLVVTTARSLALLGFRAGLSAPPPLSPPRGHCLSPWRPAPARCCSRNASGHSNVVSPGRPRANSTTGGGAAAAAVRRCELQPRERRSTREECGGGERMEEERVLRPAAESNAQLIALPTGWVARAACLLPTVRQRHVCSDARRFMRGDQRRGCPEY